MVKDKRALLGSALLLLAVASACGSSEASGKTYESADAVADAAGCGHWKPEPHDDLELFVTEGGTCAIGNAELTLNWFKNSAAQESWTQAASGIGDYILSGNGWVVYGGSKGTLQAVQNSIGGKIS